MKGHGGWVVNQQERARVMREQPCPLCTAPAGRWCVRLSNGEPYTRYVHAARLP